MLVSVVITTFNRFDSVKSAVESVLAQTYKPLELIVVEDGSNTDVSKWINQSGIDNIKYIKHDSNLGLASSRNTGLHNATGKLISFMDDDDSWESQKLEKQVALLNVSNTQNLVVYCGCRIEDRGGNIISINMPNLRGDLRSKIINSGLYTIPSSTLFRTQELTAIGGFDTDLKTGIDHDLWLKLAKHRFAADYVNEPLVRCRVAVQDAMTVDTVKRVNGIKIFIEKWKPFIIKWYGSYWGLNFIGKYYTRVIGNLGVFKIDNKLVSEGRYCLYSALIYSPRHFFHNIKYIIYLVIPQKLLVAVIVLIRGKENQ